MSEATIIACAQAFAPAAAFLASGSHLIVSYLGIPAIKDLPIASSTYKFSRIYYDGIPVIVGLAVASATTSALLAYRLPTLRSTYVTAGVTTISTIPWTVLIMASNINQLLNLSTSQAARDGVSSEAVVKMLETWSFQNYFRVGFTAVGGFIGLSALFQNAVKLV